MRDRNLLLDLAGIALGLLGLAAAWGLSGEEFLDMLWPVGVVVLLGIWLVASLAINWQLGRKEVHSAPSIPASGAGLIERLGAQRDAGAELAQEAALLEPVGNMTLVDDLVRRYNRFEEAVADLLIEADMLDPSWRRRWLDGPEWHSTDVYPVSRDQLDQMGQMIAERVRWLEQIPAVLDGAGSRDQLLDNLIRRGRDLVAETGLAGELNQGEQLEGYLRREREWNQDVEKALAAEPGLLSRFNQASDIPSVGAYAIHNRVEARVAALDEARTGVN